MMTNRRQPQTNGIASRADSAGAAPTHVWQLRGAWFLAVALAVAPAIGSVLLHPWLTNAELFQETPPTLGKDSWVRLARVNSTTLYATSAETLVTLAGAPPLGTTRDAFLIEIPAKEAGRRPASTAWTDDVLRRVFQARIDPESVRDKYYEQVLAGTPNTADSEERAAIEFLRQVEPLDDSTEFGSVRDYAVPDDFAYARRTGMRHIFALAVELPPNGVKLHGVVVPQSDLAIQPHLKTFLKEAARSGVKGLALPIIGSGRSLESDPERLELLMQTILDAARTAQAPPAVFVGLFRPEEFARERVGTAFKIAWRKILTSNSFEAKLTDIGWRLTTVLALSCLISFAQRGGRAITRPGPILMFTVAALLASRGVVETIELVEPALAETKIESWLAFSALVIVATVAGWHLPKIAVFDPKDIFTALKARVATHG